MSLSSPIDRLREQIRTAGEQRSGGVGGGVGGVELVGVAMRLGSVHEWFGVRDDARGWSPPLCAFAEVARRALAGGVVARVFWIGRKLWPYGRLLDRHPDLLQRSVLIDPPDDASRLWAMDVALRTPSPVAVIANAEGLTLPHTRRLQLAAGSGGGLCLLARPPGEHDRLSAATTRWEVTHTRSSGTRPRWTVALLRNKDRPVLTEERPSWTVEWHHAEGLVCLPAPLADRSRATQAGAG